MSGLRDVSAKVHAGIRTAEVCLFVLDEDIEEGREDVGYGDRDEA